MNYTIEFFVDGELSNIMHVSNATLVNVRDFVDKTAKAYDLHGWVDVYGLGRKHLVSYYVRGVNGIEYEQLDKDSGIE